MEIPLSLLDGALIFVAGSGVSFIGSWAGTKVTLKYMQRDISRAQETGESAHARIDNLLLHRPGGQRVYDPPEIADPTVF